MDFLKRQEVAAQVLLHHEDVFSDSAGVPVCPRMIRNFDKRVAIHKRTITPARLPVAASKASAASCGSRPEVAAVSDCDFAAIAFADPSRICIVIASWSTCEDYQKPKSFAGNCTGTWHYAARTWTVTAG